MKRILVLIFLLTAGLASNKIFSQVKQVYNPNADAAAELKAAINLAQDSAKHVLIIIGGNWCSWCLKFNNYIHDDLQIDSLLRNDFVVVKVNYSKEQKNLPLLKRFDYPQRFGFPVFLILNGKGELLHTQDSGLLESGSGYDKKKVTNFLRLWSPKALDPKKYD
ncbi:MAG: hypothetical protein A2X11_02150 [Bacteroidetes bacterium GWE2_42_24]|nr:MAG: hypothetical protein A2X11_02150 [Bacteroidetes bacterium GWE2_42_24]OFY29080.1 MAG: hypothetical protein A2X09_16100 [Bacteroidetes bacterium GWF2_43_11]